MIRTSVFFLTLVLCQGLLAFDVPRLKGAVNDRANLISRKMEKSLEHSLAQFRKKGGAHIAILTVDDLQGEEIEQASIAVTDKWKIGNKDSDNGVLIMLAKKERKVRIEVGQGLEGALPDAYAKRIIDNAMLPLFRQGDFSKGILLGVYQVAQRTNPEIKIFSQRQTRNWRASRRDRGGFKSYIYIILFILFFIFGGRSPFGALLLGASLGGRRYGGGGFGGGGFGGGGFSGGGGGFSGGGASGGW